MLDLKIVFNVYCWLFFVCYQHNTATHYCNAQQYNNIFSRNKFWFKRNALI